MAAYVVFELSDGRREWLRDADQIGRGPKVVLNVPDRRVSAVHAHVSHRRSGLTLFAWGPVHLMGQPVTEVTLAVGQVFRLPGTERLTVVELHNTSRGGAVVDDTEKIDMSSVVITASNSAVVVSGGGLRVPMPITGKAALAIIHLIKLGEPVPWYRVAKRVWPRQTGSLSVADHKNEIRARWDAALYRLRDKLKNHGLSRPLLLSNDGTLMLAMLPGDQIVDNAD